MSEIGAHLRRIPGLESLYGKQSWHPNGGIGLCIDPFDPAFCFAGDGDGSPEMEVLEQAYDIIRDLRPTACAETGTSDGYFSVVCARALEDNDHGHLWTCEINPLRSTATPRPWPKWFSDLKIGHRITPIIGNSADPGVWERANPPLPDKIQFAFVDSLHEKDHVLAEWRVLGPRMTPNGAVLFHDSRLFEGVAVAVNEIEASFPGVVRKELRSARGASLLVL